MSTQIPNAPNSSWSSRRLRRSFVTPELISGTILVSVVIAVADENNGVADVFAITVLSVLVFWATQVFIVTIAVQGLRGDEEAVSVSKSFRIAINRSFGLLLAAIPPLIFMFIGIFGFTHGQIAYWIALWIEVALLAVLGWIAFTGRGTAWYWKLCGSLATAGLGILAIVLKILIS
ncbi:hypothetical protein [Subtercola sp. YIM 133946]|uniref:hypothetical protein n=1 Tax=Subtercola sp. YIM 133946 TaxID=3118909 RepID=UPI002F9292BE